ncbi:hypothetical protein [Nocardia cyriacigeorgica]|uniref:hypothetical protein n=1 Tax=Nocardia cyriacigeorgica TaxID=135487 RepID=UPI0018942D6D|nr:hypothetical protein [Nocardia cyriacigeorgica]MBF6325879.1 hypothetical protein [Nocardia cyriacigeorgica]
MTASSTHVAAAPLHAQLPDPIAGLCDVPGGPKEACELALDTAGSAANTALGSLVEALVEALTTSLRWAMTWWTSIPSPQLTGYGGGSALTAIRDYTSELQVIVLTAGVLFCAARLALARRGETIGEAQESFVMLARATFGAMAFAAVITAGSRAGDGFADWVLHDASNSDQQGVVEGLMILNAETLSGLGTGLLLIVALLGVISMLVQLVMLVVRQALLILVVAVIPLAAAATGTGPGSQAYKKLLSWALAFVLFKPVGALVYAVAFTVVGGEEQVDPQQVLLGLILLMLNVLVLPALVKLAAPAVATLGGGGGAGSVLAGGAVGIAMAAAGSRSGGRKISEGENSTPRPPVAGPHGGGSAADPGGGGRPMSGVGTGDAGAAVPKGSAPTGPAPGAGRAGVAPTAGAAKSASAAKTSAAAAGPAGVAVAAAEHVKGKAQQGLSALEQAAEAPGGIGPGEVRR